jgi:hypothetical protein
MAWESGEPATGPGLNLSNSTAQSANTVVTGTPFTQFGNPELDDIWVVYYGDGGR